MHFQGRRTFDSPCRMHECCPVYSEGLFLYHPSDNKICRLLWDELLWRGDKVVRHHLQMSQRRITFDAYVKWILVLISFLDFRLQLIDNELINIPWPMLWRSMQHSRCQFQDLNSVLQSHPIARKLGCCTMKVGSMLWSMKRRTKIRWINFDVHDVLGCHHWSRGNRVVGSKKDHVLIIGSPSQIWSRKQSYISHKILFVRMSGRSSNIEF